MILKIFPKLNDVRPSNQFFSKFLYSRAPTSEKWKRIYSSKISATKLGKKSELKSTFFLVSWCILLRYKEFFFLKKCSAEKALKEVVANVSKIISHNLFPKSNDVYSTVWNKHVGGNNHVGRKNYENFINM